jgi:hypothetical protein
MLDTPLVRGERGVFVPLVGGVRLDMALERKEGGTNTVSGGWTLSLFYLKLTLARGLTFSLAAHCPPHPHSSRSSPAQGLGKVQKVPSIHIFTV